MRNNPVIYVCVKPPGLHHWGDFHELRLIIEHVTDRTRVGVVWTPAPPMPQGYDLSTEEGFQELLDDFERIIGWQFLRGLHLKDSKGKWATILTPRSIGKGNPSDGRAPAVINCDISTTPPPGAPGPQMGGGRCPEKYRMHPFFQMGNDPRGPHSSLCLPSFNFLNLTGIPCLGVRESPDGGQVGKGSLFPHPPEAPQSDFFPFPRAPLWEVQQPLSPPSGCRGKRVFPAPRETSCGPKRAPPPKKQKNFGAAGVFGGNMHLLGYKVGGSSTRRRKGNGVEFLKTLE
ncbi:putative endonuclease 4 [Chionoecetes opilio]|uniref:Putative endonuclease 4 n=1 Tax=Chionoecetes opilio TaxID=41210 RepID=A0A8J5CRU5_CHIOP|nr:putative endonuclease 4 [Chionoecetes opilio]